MEDQLAELVSFLSPQSRPDVQSIALDSVLGLTGTSEGCIALAGRGTLIETLLDLAAETSRPALARDSLMALLNLSASEEAAGKLNDLPTIPRLSQMLIDPGNSAHVNQLAMILSNLTRHEKGSITLTDILTNSNVTLTKLIELFDKSRSTTVEYLATVFSNITQVLPARLMFLDKAQTHVARLIPYVQYRESLIRRGGVIGCLRNLTFEVGYHEWLLSDEVDILPPLLLPLAGPEELTDEENDQLPLDCQYLPDEKEREGDPQLRKMLLETIMKLCATKYGRIYMRKHGVYFILRELHKWEVDPSVKETCENLISVLISDEPEPDLENLDSVEIPPELVKQFETNPKN